MGAVFCQSLHLLCQQGYCRAAEKDNRAETCSLSLNARLCRLPHEFHAKGQCSVEIRTDVALYEKGSQDVFSDNLRFIYLSLPFFDKKAEECESDFDKWIYVLKHMEALERMPFTAQKKIFKRLAELADSRCLSQEEQEKYDESLKAADDYYGVLMSYYMNGIDEGVAKGEAKGSYHKSLDIAKKMLLKGMDDDSIMELTGLTHEQLLQLKS